MNRQPQASRGSQRLRLEYVFIGVYERVRLNIYANMFLPPSGPKTASQAKTIM